MTITITMSSSVDKILNIIRTILYANESPSRYGYFYFDSEEFLDTDLSLVGLDKILKKLKKEKCIEYIYSDSYAVFEPKINDFKIGKKPQYVWIKPNQDYLEQYAIDLENRYRSFSQDKKKVALVISEADGIYIKDHKVKNYAIAKKRLQLVKNLRGGTVPAKMLCALQKQTVKLLSKEISTINKLFAENVYPADLINHVPTGGYSLNKKTFSITFEIP